MLCFQKRHIRSHSSQPIKVNLASRMVPQKENFRPLDNEANMDRIRDVGNFFGLAFVVHLSDITFVVCFGSLGG